MIWGDDVMIVLMGMLFEFDLICYICVVDVVVVMKIGCNLFKIVCVLFVVGCMGDVWLVECGMMFN